MGAGAVVKYADEIVELGNGVIETAYGTGVKSIDFDDGFKGFDFDTNNEYAKELLAEKDGGKGYGVLNFSDNYKNMSSPISEIQKLNVPCVLEEK